MELTDCVVYLGNGTSTSSGLMFEYVIIWDVNLGSGVSGGFGVENVMIVDVGNMMSSADPAPLNVIQSSSSSLIQSVESSVDTMISSANPCIGVVCYKHKNILLIKISSRRWEIVIDNIKVIAQIHCIQVKFLEYSYIYIIYAAKLLTNKVLLITWNECINLL